MPESFEGALDILGNLFPRPLGGFARGQVIADHVKVDLFQLVSRPVSRQRLALKNVVGVLSEFAEPFRLPFHIDDIVDCFLRQADTGIARRRNVVEKITDIPIDSY